MGYAPWRRMQWQELEEFARKTARALAERWQMGVERYDSAARGFQGDPVKHAQEEVSDLCTYLFYIEREREALKQELAEAQLALAEARQEIAELKAFDAGLGLEP